MKEYKSFGQILRENLKQNQEVQRRMSENTLEVCAANPPVLALLPLMLDYESLIKDKGLTGEEERFVYAIRAIDMIIHTEAFTATAVVSGVMAVFDTHIMPRLDTPYPDRYGAVVISLLEELMERQDQFFKVYKKTTFTNRIKAVEARMSYGLDTVRNDT